MIPWGLDFCILGHLFSDPWVHRDSKGGTLGSEAGFSVILERFGDPLGDRFSATCDFCLKFGATNLQGRFLGMFFNRFGCGNDTRI